MQGKQFVKQPRAIALDQVKTVQEELNALEVCKRWKAI